MPEAHRVDRWVKQATGSVTGQVLPGIVRTHLQSGLMELRETISKGVSPTSAVLAWVVLVVIIAVYVVAFDVWASKTAHRTMSNQFGHWLTETIAGPIILGIWAGVFVALSFHFAMEAIRRH